MAGALGEGKGGLQVEVVRAMPRAVELVAAMEVAKGETAKAAAAAATVAEAAKAKAAAGCARHSAQGQWAVVATAGPRVAAERAWEVGMRGWGGRAEAGVAAAVVGGAALYRVALGARVA